MKRKIVKYLKNKEESQYTVLDNIFKLYIDGHLEELLNNYGFSEIKFYPHIRKNSNYLQIDFWYYNLVVNIQFDDLCFDYCIYLPGISAEKFDKGFIESNYSDNFNIENFISYLHTILNKDDRLNRLS
ncbi:MAG: hypothetical protein A2Y17_11535 [Clostridiales bacterium GWF2_38_85]|nr:MAG: hypothetical protein A2Y17_11535 [Clostridiales bacterium GWF2_38_85]HBL85193.1 hypothetical protein [Clostridiales bacterium]